MKIAFVSNIILNLVSQKLNKKANYEISTHYGDVVSILNQYADLGDADFVIIHVDSVFQKLDDMSLDHICGAIKRFSANSKSTILVSSIFGNDAEGSLKSSSSAFNIYPAFLDLKLASNIYEFDFLNSLLQVGLPEAFNYASGFLYQMPYKKPLIELLANDFHQYIKFLSTPEKKVIITDADNTLWGGILGEDGIENLKVNQNADGIVYQSYQKFLKKKKEEGFLLAICSKNNHDDVKEAFEKLNMPLNWDDFIVKQINWEPKYINISKIASKLNLGIASFIFIDDNDFEIESVSQMSNTEISCFKFENDYNTFLNISQSFDFKKKQILASDLKKHDQYLENQQRDAFKDNAGDFEKYIKSLEIINTLAVNDLNNAARLSQMTEKTNQFNFNKTVFSEAQISDFIQKGGNILSYSSKDKFGDYGIIGLALIDQVGNEVSVKNILMSCRALGKGIETDFYNDIITFAENKGGFLKEFIYIKSEKNQLAADFYENIRKNNFDGKQFRKTAESI